MQKMKKSVAITILTLTILLYIVASCTSKDARLGKLDGIDSLMEQNPQAAYDSLCHSKEQMTANGPKNITMRYRLLEAKAQNKLYLQMPSDSAFQEVVEYYDNNGSSNDKMQAYYLQGCIYRDQKEAPKSMQFYQKALEYADTLNNDCDYNTLFSIYGQMAQIYHVQYLYPEALECYKKYSYFALEASRVYDHIRGKEFEGGIYYAMGDTSKALGIAKQCFHLYERHKMHQEAVAVLPTIIYTEVLRQNYSKVHLLMENFRTQSGLFNANGDIMPGREHYYYTEGLYYLGISQIDSAEYSFRKLLKAGYCFDAYKGLMTVYRTRENIDSVMWYTALCEKALDSTFVDNKAYAVQQVTAMYKYDRIQREAAMNALKLENNRLFILVGFIVGAIIILLIVRLYKKRMEGKQQEVESKTQAYLLSLKHLEQLKEEVATIKNDSKILMQKKQEEITLLQQKLERESEQMSPLEKGKLIDTDATYQKFLGMSWGKIDCHSLVQDDWMALEKLVRLCYPKFYSVLSRKNVLSDFEWKVCLLVRLQFSSSQILSVFGKNSSMVSNAKRSANKKLFGGTDAYSLYNNMLAL